MKSRDIVKKHLTEFELKRWDELFSEVESCRKEEFENTMQLMEIRKRQNKAMRKMEQFWSFSRSKVEK